MGDSTTIPTLFPGPIALPFYYHINPAVQRQHLTSLVSVADVRAHLKLLGAFYTLRQQVESAPGLAETNKDGAWALFVSRAVHRFDKWAWRDSITHAPHQESSIPPLDVVMVHHTYLLNPRMYSEDTIHRNTRFHPLPTFNIIEAASRIDDDLHPTALTTEQTDAFQLATSQSFNPPIITSHFDTCTVRCPECSTERAVWWVNEEGTGYGQKFFHTTCTICFLRFDREAMGIRKLCEDLKDGSGGSLSGTLIDARTGHYSHYTKGGNLRIAIGKGLAVLGATPQAVGGAVRWQMSRVEEECRKSFLGPRASKGAPTPRRLIKTLNAYRHPERASVELVGAVIRQASFIQKMVGLEWTTPSRFEADEGPTATPLIRAINRYHAFLYLMRCTTDPIVPTLDIDLVWHTHQLNAEHYRTSTLAYVARIPDHDDTVEESSLSNAFDQTAKLWRERFGSPYSICGCSPEPDWKIEVNRTAAPPEIGGAMSFKAPGNIISLGVDAPEDCDTTHPSDHNAVMIVGDKLSELKKRRREDDVEHRAHFAWKQSQRRAEKGKPLTWTDVQVRNRTTKREGHSEGIARAAPFWGGQDLPYAYYGFCRCTYDGNVILSKPGECIAGSGTGSCAVGGGAACANKAASYCGTNDAHT